MIVVHTGRADGLEQMYINRPRMNPKRPFWHYLDRSMDDHRNNWHTGGNGEHEGTFFEWTQRIGVPARSLREDDDRASATDFFSGDVVGPKRCLPVIALDLDHADGAHAPALRQLRQINRVDRARRPVRVGMRVHVDRTVERLCPAAYGSEDEHNQKHVQDFHAHFFSNCRAI